MKGPSWLTCLKSLDFITGFSIDYMHCVLLGVSKLLLSLWLEPSRCRGTSHDLHSQLNLLDDRFSRLHVPSMIRRKPRGLNDLKHWKGTSSAKFIMYLSAFRSCTSI